MRADPLPSRIDLEHRSVLALDDPSDVNLTCREGTLWLTLDGDPRDYVLEAGDSFRTVEHRRALVYALTPSRVELSACLGGKKVAPPSRNFHLTPAMNVAH